MNLKRMRVHSGQDDHHADATTPRPCPGERIGEHVVKPSWPDDYPPQCPPTDAAAAGGRFLRLVEADPPNGSDFVSVRKLYPHRRVPDECEAWGLSVFSDEMDARRMRDRVAGLREKRVAVGELTAQHGRLKPTPRGPKSSHHTWWVPAGVDPAAAFSVMAESPGDASRAE